MYQEAQLIAVLRKSNRRGQSQIQRRRINNQSQKKITSFLQKVCFLIQSIGNRLDTYAILDREPAVSFIDQNKQEKVPAQGTDATLEVIGIHGTKDLQT